MNYRNLGKSGLMVSELCFGAMTFTGDEGWKHVGDMRQREADEVVGLCLDAGVNFFDTADIYSDGASEEILGKALGGRRKDIVLCTKVGLRVGPEPNDNGCSRHRILQGCDESLRRLGTDYIDLYLLHAFDPAVDLEETMEALNDLVRAGKVRYIGCSNFAGWQLMKAQLISRYSRQATFVNIQVLYNLLQRDIEHEILPVCLDQGIGLTAWGPLAGGFLAGKYRPNEPWPSGTRMTKPGEHYPFDEKSAHRVIETLASIAGAHQATIPQAALNWLLQKAGVSSLVIGARTKEQLRDNLKTADWRMTDEEHRRLDAVSAPATLYPQWYFKFYRRDRFR